MGNVLSQPPTVKDTLYQDGVLRMMVCSACKRKDGHRVTTPCNKLDLPNCKKWNNSLCKFMADRARRVHCCSVFAHPETITTTKKEKEKKTIKNKQTKNRTFSLIPSTQQFPPLFGSRYQRQQWMDSQLTVTITTRWIIKKAVSNYNGSIVSSWHFSILSLLLCLLPSAI